MVSPHDNTLSLFFSLTIQENLALSPDELASIAFERGWLRPPSIAVAPSTMIQNAIRMHQSRCAKATPPRKPLVTKYQLAGSTAEAVLAPALHPNAFENSLRPKGPVWYLSPEVGRAKWRNPFSGLVVPKAPARKPTAKPKAKSKKEAKKEKRGSKESTPADSDAAVPRLKLRVQPTDEATGHDSDLEGSSRISSRSMTVDSVEAPPPTLLPPPLLVSSTPVRKQRRRRNVLDSSDSESSDSDEEVPASRQRQARRIVLPPSVAAVGTRPPPSSRSSQSSLGALFFSPVTTGPLPLPPVSLASPFPHHSLDNTIWAARNNLQTIALDASSSSSDDELCDDWGTNSGLMIKADDELLTWTQDEDPKLSEATTAMQELFPYEESMIHHEPVYNQLDNHPTASETSSVTDASTLNAVYQGKLKNAACPAALPAWALSSPVSSPNLVGRSLPVVETSPTQYLARVREYDRSMDMDVDVTPNEEAWLDESGQLPVHAEDSFSDVEFGSTVGDLPTPECERHIQTAVWARETAETAGLIVKQEPEDYYPSPAATTASNDDSSLVFQGSRESTASAQSPSSGSELTPYEYSDSDHGAEFLVGPESIGMDELDDWLPYKTERTPLRGRRAARNDPSRCSGSWGGIGVVPPILPSTKATPPPLVRKRSLRSCSRRNNRSTPRKTETRLPPTQTPAPEEVVVLEAPVDLKPETIEIDLEYEDAIGADDLEQARVEAEAREEEHRAQKRAEAEENRRRWQACRRAFADAANGGSGSVSPVATPSGSVSLDTSTSTPWLENSGGIWSSSESVPDLLTPSCMSPLALQITPMATEKASLDLQVLMSPPANPNLMILDSVLSQAEIDAANASLPPPQPVPQPALPAAAPAPTVSPKLSPKLSPKISPKISPKLSPKIAKRHIAIAPAPEKKIAPKIAPRPEPKVAPKPAQPETRVTPAPLAAPVARPTPVVVAPKPITAPVPLTPSAAPLAPAAASAPAIATPISAPVPPPANAVVAAPIPTVAAAPTPMTAPSTAAPTRTVSPVARTTTSSPATSSVISTSSASSSAASRSSTPSSSGGTTKRLLPGIDACVIDNLPCYSHVYELPNGNKCTVLRRLDTDFVNGTALLTAVGVPADKQIKLLQAPGPTVQSHRSVPLISPQGQQHAAGVPGVWIPLVTARDVARKLGLRDGKNLLSNILREDLFQLFKELAGISLRHTTSTEFGVPFVTQPHLRKPVPQSRPMASSLPDPSALRVAAPKSPLVRGPVAPPEGVPQAKRRRSTVVAGQSGPAGAAAAIQQSNGQLPTARPLAAPAKAVLPPAPASAPAAPMPQAQAGRILKPTPPPPAKISAAKVAAPRTTLASTPVRPTPTTPLPPRRTRASIGAK